MMRGATSTAVRLAFFLATLLTSQIPKAGLASTEARRQTQIDDPMLDSKVSISCDSTTLAKVLEELSARCGLSIVATDAIKDRRMTVELVDRSARTALDAITESYDWRWYKQQRGVYVVDRRQAHAPMDPRGVPAAMQAALPIDMRIFMKLPDLKAADRDARTMNAAIPAVSNAGAASVGKLRAALADLFRQQDSVAVRDLTAEQRKGLLALLVFDRMRHTLEILHDNDGPHRYDPSMFELRYRAAELGLDVITNSSVMPGLAFGTQVFFADGRPIPADFGRTKAP